MARIRTKPNSQSIRDINAEDNWSRLVERITMGDYILVVGSEIVLSNDVDMPVNGDSTQYMLKTVVEMLKEEQLLGEHYDCNSFTELSHAVPNLHKVTARCIKEGVIYEEIDISQHLLDLLKTRCFRIVITTTFDEYVEKAMRIVWGDSLRVMNIFDTIGPDKDFSPIEQNADDYYDIQPTLYYAFGKVDDERNYMLTENDAILTMSKWLNRGHHPKFMNYISNKRILAVGCKLEDWLFRFFWYALQQDITKLTRGEVAITLDLEHSQLDESLNRYLQQNEVFVYPDAREFISRLVNSLNITIPEMQSVINRRTRNGVFISYANEDKSIALQIFSALINRGIDVWIDEKKLGGDIDNNYNSRIAAAIGQCKVFVPLLGKQTIEDFNGNQICYKAEDLDSDNIRYYSKEWWIAENSIMPHTQKPIALYGYDCRSEIHKNIFADHYPSIYNANVFNLYERSFSEFIESVESILRNY